MYTGEYNHSIDTKGRLIVPSRFREELGDKFMITKGLDGCLYVYDNIQWASFQQKLTAMPNNSKNIRDLKRYFLGGATPLEIDKQGRALLPQNLRNCAGIIKDVVLIGVGEKIEVWAKEVWEGESAENSMEDIADKMSELGLDI